MRGAARGALPAALLAVAALFTLLGPSSHGPSLALAQPYAADGGFDRPRELVASQTRPAVALAVDRGEAVVVRIDGRRVLRESLPADAEEARDATVLASDETFWDVAAAGSPDGTERAVYGWYHRDFTTGRYAYAWHTDGETRALLDAQQVLDLQLAVGPDGPEAWITRVLPAGSRVERIRWSDPDDAAPAAVVSSDLGIAGLAVAYDASGTAHLAYLEGYTRTTEFGVDAEWSARYTAIDGAGAPEHVDLGLAAPPPGRLVVVPDESSVLWTNAAGQVVASDVRAAGGDEGADAFLGRGRPVAATAEQAFWVDGFTIAARARPLEVSAPRNVAWSPLGVERASAVRDGDGVTHLVWVGRRVGSGYALLASDDRSPMVRTPADRVAAAFGWSPWTMAEEALAQVAGALLVGILVTMALVPVFWLGAALVVPRVPHERTRLVGALGGAAVVALALVGVAAAATPPAEAARSLVGLPWAAPLALLVGVAAGMAALRRADLESLQAIVLTACATCFVATTLLAFATFQPWLAFLGM